MAPIVKFEAGKIYGTWANLRCKLVVSSRTDRFVTVMNGGHSSRCKVYVDYIDGEPIEYFKYGGRKYHACIEW